MAIRSSARSGSPTSNLPIRIVATLVFLTLVCCARSDVRAAEVRCGASSIDVTPRQLPVIRNGGFLQATDNTILDPLHARCVVLDDGEQRVAIVVVDSCMIPLSLCDEAKQIASKATGIAADHIMISATHTHTAPSVMRYCLGSGVDEPYRAFLPGKIAESIEIANGRLQPAQVGWTRIDGSDFTRCRRWITRTDKLQTDPFGELTVHANMHPGHLNPDFVGPSGPVDPWLSLLMIADRQGHPIAALANFSMHYFSGHSGVSSDYYGRFATKLATQLASENPQFVGIMSQGTSGDLWWGDYSRPRDEKPFQDIDDFSYRLVELALRAIENVEYVRDAPVRIAERRLTIERRLPNPKRLAWARRMNQLRGDRLPKDRPEVYALQAVYLHENPTDEVVLQAVRVGDLGMTGIPNEVYALTGLKLKRRSPLAMTFNISLANGACGYIPPPEQHVLGGYNTWPARTAGLEEVAEPKIVETLLELLESVADRPRKEYVEPPTRFSQRVLESSPYAYWRLAEMEQREAVDDSKNARQLRQQGPVAYHLPGRIGDGFGRQHDSHAIQLAGGKLVADNLELGESYSVQLSFFLGTPVDFRALTGILISRGDDQLAISGTASDTPGRLAFAGQLGSTPIQPHHWHQLVFVRNGDFVQLFLDGRMVPEISAKVARAKPANRLALGGNLQDTANLEGKLDEVSVYDRALTTEEIQGLFSAAGYSLQSAPAEQLKSDPLDANSSMGMIHVRDGYRVELVASEPLVVDPVAIDWGADGKLWVAEMADYPMGIDGNGQPGGRIRFLEDEDGDGNYDQSTIFLEGISFPNGVMAWRNGVLVTAAPEVFFAADTDGDGKADVRENLLSGFMTGNQQLRVNGLRWGLDNMIHCASGAHHAGFGAGNSIFSARSGKSIELGSRDFRFHPDTGDLDPESGPSQFGRVRDDFGNWFGVQNSQPLWHYVLSDQHLRRNPHVPGIDPRRQVRMPRMPEVFSAKPPQRRFHGFDHAGHYTSACGISIYRDELLFPRSEVHAFTCEPFHNLVQHHVLSEAGPSFQGRRADDGPVDFFASTDRWTRPVMTRTGPDGALWIVDMYRYMIEHPQWLPQEGKDALRPGYRAGDQLGRIYRILPANDEGRTWPAMAGHSSEELTALLEHPNGIVRDLSHRRLLERQAGAPLDDLRTIAREARLPESRIQALSVLDALGGIDPETLQAATQDKHAGVRRQAIRIAEKLPPEQIERSAVLTLENDPDAKVRLQLAASSGQWSCDRAGQALARIAMRPDNDEYTTQAIVSSLPQHYEAVAQAVLAKGSRRFDPATSEDSGDVLVDALLLVGERFPEYLAKTLDRLVSDDANLASRISLARWLDSLADRKQTLTSLTQEHPEIAASVAKINQITKHARMMSQTHSLDVGERVSAIGLLGRDPTNYRHDVEILDRLLSSDQPKRVQAAASQRLASIPLPGVASTLLSHWPEYLPSQRSRTVTTLLERPTWALQLLDAIQNGTVRSADLSLAHQQALRSSRNSHVSRRSAELLGTTSSDRGRFVARYVAELGVGNVSLGRQVFEKNCLVCHALDRSQTLVGPDLRSLTTRSRRALLNSILDPSQTVDPKFSNYSIVLKNGETLTGIIADEGAGSVQLVDAQGKSHTILRDSIELIQRAEKSIMPDGFETKISAREMSDLIAFLQQL